MTKEENFVKHGTTTVGIVCKDCLVLAADKRATAGNLIADKMAKKIYGITDDIAMTMAGTASDAQLVIKISQSELSLKEIRTGKKASVKEAANLVGRLVYNNIRKMSMIPGISHFVMGGADKTGFYLYDIFPDGTVSECEGFISSGSGSVMAYGVLETLYKKDISMEDGIKLAVKCISAAIQRDSASGEGIDIWTVTGKGAKEYISKRIETKIEI